MFDKFRKPNTKMFGLKTKPMPESWEIPPPAHHGSQPPCIDDFFPPPPSRSDTMHSRYVQMLLDQDNISMLHSILAPFFVWLLLAGFLVFPGTFTTISKSIEEKQGKDLANKTAETIVKSVHNVPLLVIGALICAASVIGMTCLGLKHRKNYVWLLNKLFFPGMANCLAALISTLVGVYSQQKGVWSPTAQVTAIVEGVCLAICITLWFVIDHFFLEKVKEVHGVHYNGWTKDPLSDVEPAHRF